MAGSATPPREDAAAAFLTATLDRSAALDRVTPALADLRRTARASLASTGLPIGALETFKYTPIARFYRAELLQAEPASIRMDAPENVALRPLDDADAHLDRHVDHLRHPLARVNAGIATGGTMIHVKSGVRPDRPVSIEYAEGTAVTRLLVVVDEGAALTLIESDPGTGVANRVCEIVTAPGASVTHLRVQRRSVDSVWALIAADLAANSQYRLRTYAAGGAPRRNDVHVRLTGEAADADLKGAFIALDGAILDNQVVVEHAAPRTTSRHRFHAVAARRAELTFNGRIHIHPHCPGADGELRTANLLLDASARINSKPELEIYTDDVKCAHGATVGQLDEAALFYLRSRGLSEQDARSLLIRAFAESILTSVAHAPLRSYLEQRLEARFGAQQESSP